MCRRLTMSSQVGAHQEHRMDPLLYLLLAMAGGGGIPPDDFDL